MNINFNYQRSTFGDRSKTRIQR